MGRPVEAAIGQSCFNPLDILCVIAINNGREITLSLNESRMALIQTAVDTVQPMKNS
jgi:hypothetical protein